MIQRIILIAIIVILTGALTLLTVFYFSDDDTKQTIKDIAGDQVSLISKFSNTVTESKNTLTRISDNGAPTYGVLPDGNRIAFFDNDGAFNIATLEGDSILEGTVPLASNIRNAVWSPTELEAIITSVSSNGVQKIFYDYRNGKINSIDSDIQDIAFSQDGKYIVYNFFDTDTYEGNISLSRTDGTSYVMLFKTRLPDVKIDWPTDDLVTFYKRSSNDRERVELFRMTDRGEDLEKILTDKYLLRVLWAPDGKSLIYSDKSDDRNHLYYKFMKNSDETNLEMNVSAEQCAWSNTNVNIICFDDGHFYKINVLDGSKEKIYRIGGSSDVKKLTVTSSGEYLLFINNGQLYSLSLR
jgi:dipeptidyl aminopeptidase/acylaminoacyl peptidase